MTLCAVASSKSLGHYVSHFSSSKVMGGCTHKTFRVYSSESKKNLSLKNCEEIQKLIKKGELSFSNLTLPRKDLDKQSISNLLTMIGKHKEALAACGSTNPAAMFKTAKVFLKPDFAGLKAMERDLKEGKNIWGYQMQNIPLNETNIAQLADHILEIYKKNTVVLTVDANATELFRPEIDPETTNPNLSNRKFMFFDERNEFNPIQHKEDL